jgi:hypothetical protein
VSQTNDTLTYFADHSQGLSHDAVKRDLEEENITARWVWENVKSQVMSSPEGYWAFDDTVLDDNRAFKIELVRRQYSGNVQGMVQGIGVVPCVYINPELNQFWIIDYRIYDPDHDGKTKLEHVREMLEKALSDKQRLFRGVLMDTGYAEGKLMVPIEDLKQVSYCPLKPNRVVDDSDQQEPYQRIDPLNWTPDERPPGKTRHIKDFPKGHRVKRFRLALSSERTDYIATHDLAQDSAHDTQQGCALRWKIEQFHRETKPTTGIEGCQCRLAPIQRNPIGCAILVWVRLKHVAQETAASIYQLKQRLLHHYIRTHLRSPAIKMQFA